MESLNLSRSEVRTIVRRYEKGLEAPVSIADDFGCTAETIRRLLRQEGVTMRGRGRPTLEEIEHRHKYLERYGRSLPASPRRRTSRR